MDCCRNKIIEKKLPEDVYDQIILVGTPNVGKSVIFNKLTGSYVTVSNYPGTTVEISRGFSTIGGKKYEVIDTPGMYSLNPITDEERVTRRMLLKERRGLICHVVDAKNLDRMLSLTLQLKDAGFPLILVVNMMDEASRLGIKIDTDKLSKKLNLPVVATAAAINQGLDELRRMINEYTEKYRAVS